MTILESLKEKSKNLQKKVILPESNDPRILQATHQILKERLAHIHLIASPAEIHAAEKQHKLDLSSARIIDVTVYSDFDLILNAYIQNQKEQNLDGETASRELHEPINFGAMLVKESIVDGMVAGSSSTTAAVLRAGIKIIGVNANFKAITSCFLMIDPSGLRAFTFADCGVIPQPNSEVLAEIAIASAQTHEALTESEPKVALLSFSTTGSAEHESITKIRHALRLVREKKPDLLIDGELQADAAISSEIAKAKAPESVIRGDANVLIFPDLNAGNIAYKLVQRLGGYHALGPILQGTAKPIHDLSRGCSVQDIINMVCVTSILGAKYQ